MVSAEIVEDFNNLSKPFRLIERHAHCGGTDYETICRLTETHARLLAAAGVSWLYGEPNWDEHSRKIELYRAEAAKEEAEKRIKELTA